MKQVLFIIGLCLITTAAFAQKTAVTGAERMVKDSRSNLNEARNLIKGAMGNAETKDDAKTWFVAGQVEDTQFNRENTKQILGQKPNEPVMYEALSKALPLFIKAYELDQRPDDRGRVRPRYNKNIIGILSANHIYYINAGGYWYDEQDYKKAYDFFEQFLEIANLPFMAGTKAAVRDSNYMNIQFFSCVTASLIQNSELFIQALIRAKEFPYRQYDIYQWLSYEYEQLKDTVNLEKLYGEGMKIFPDSSYFLFNLINVYITSDRNEQAISMLNTAIAKNPTNPQLYQALGSVYERGFRDNDKAEDNYKKALELEPNSAVNLFNLGRVYYNEAANKLNEANLITDTRLYNEAKTVVKGLFEKARPYFEKAHQMEPKEMDFMFGLRGIYYNLDMGKEFAEIEAKMGVIE